MALGRRLSQSTSRANNLRVTPTGGSEDDLADLFAAKVSAAGGNASATVVTATDGATARTLAARARDFGANILDFGGSDDGVTDNYAAWLLASAAAGPGGTVIFPLRYGTNQTYLMSDQMELGTASGAAFAIGVGGEPWIKFSGLSSTEDCIVFRGNSYRRQGARYLQVDCNRTGRHGIVYRAGTHPILENVDIWRSKKDGLGIHCRANYEWVENALFRSVTLHDNGRHGFSLLLEGNDGVVANYDQFITEALFYAVEVRGVSQQEDGGIPFYFHSKSSYSGAQISNITWIGCNADSDWQAAVDAGYTPGTYIMRGEYDASARNFYVGWTIQSAGWESTTGTVPAGAKLVSVASGATTRGWLIQNLTVYQYSGVEGLDAYLYINLQDDRIETNVPMLIGTTTEVANHDLVVASGIATRGSVGAVSIHRRDTDAQAFSLFSAAGKLSFYHSGLAATSLEIDTSGHVVPGATATYDVGTTSVKFRDMWASRNVYGDKVLVGTTSDVSNYNGIFGGGILTRGSTGALAIYRRDTDVAAWAMYSPAGDLAIFSSNLAAVTWEFDTARRFRPGSDLQSEIGLSNRRVTNLWAQKMTLIDGITAPTAVTGHAQIYIDSADGDLKIIFADGTIKTIVTDT